MSIKTLLTLKESVLALVFLSYSGLSMAANVNELKQLEAAENIEMASQEVTKAYFYLGQGIRVEQSEKDLEHGLVAIEKDIKILSKTKNKEQQRMMQFMSFTMDEIKETIGQTYSKENGALMLDYSETLLEGAESIAQKHIHKGDKTEAMLVAVEKMIFLLERATKYYIAFKAGFTDHNNVVQLEKSIKDFESYLKKVSAQKYSGKSKRAIDKIDEYWPIAKGFYLGVEKSDFPLIVSITTKHLEKSLATLERHYHDKALGKK